VQETDIQKYFAFGYDYYILRFVSENRSVHGQHSSLVWFIDEFFSWLSVLNLPVTETAAQELRLLRDELEKLPKKATVGQELANKVKIACDKLDATLDAELKLRSAFVVTPKRLSQDHLLRSPGDLFAPNVFQKLPILARFDFTEAGKCIAFGLPTAAAFHIMRATEGVLRFYYCSIVKRNRVKHLLWNDIVQHLRRRHHPPPKALTDNLDNLRVNFRNPTQHPEARYDIDEAQDLFFISIDVVNRMIKNLQTG
jgi:hypothetical protein